MVEEDKSQLEKAVEILDELLESDELSKEEWHKINEVFHTLEDMLEE